MRKKVRSLGQLIELVDDQLQQLMQSNLQELHLSRQQIQTLDRQKRELKRMLQKCGIGDIAAKKYIKHTIQTILTEKLQLEQEEKDCILPVRDEDRMSARDMFEIMLCCYGRQYGKKALERWILEHGLDQDGAAEQDICEITQEQVCDIFHSNSYRVSEMEQLSLIVQRVYAEYRGLGVVDEIRDMDIDGVSGGVNGLGSEERSVWIMFQGKSIYLSFLCFGNKKNLQRICRTIYRHGQPGQLSQKRGYVVNEMADHARVVVARPDFCENWVFFVRKLDNLESKRLEDLFREENADVAALLLKTIVKGCQTIGITGEQGCGKTTLLMSLIEHICGRYTIRIQETAFELQLRRLYPKRNIVSFRETGTISGQEGLDFQKKTDGTVSIVGEVASAKQAALMLQLGQTASLYTMFTHHANSTRNLVWALQNNLLQEGQFSDERTAQRQVVEVVRFHVHLVRERGGRRRIDYITEIVPLTYQGEDGCCFEERCLLCYHDGSYRLMQHISEDTLRKMQMYIREEELSQYEQKVLSVLKQNSSSEKPDPSDEAADAVILSTR